MKVTKLDFLGHTYHLFYNSEAMLTLQEKFGQGAELVNAINPTTKDGKRILCEAVMVMAEQGELARRYYGYDHSEIPTVEQFQLFSTPRNVFELFGAAVRAITAGYGHEIEADDGQEIDLVLQELEKKT